MSKDFSVWILNCRIHWWSRIHDNTINMFNHTIKYTVVLDSLANNLKGFIPEGHEAEF